MHLYDTNACNGGDKDENKSKNGAPSKSGQPSSKPKSMPSKAASKPVGESSSRIIPPPVVNLIVISLLYVVSFDTNLFGFVLISQKK